MFVITITDTNTGNTATAVTTAFVANAVFTGAEVGLDGADEDTTGFTPEILKEADAIVSTFQKFATS